MTFDHSSENHYWENWANDNWHNDNFWNQPLTTTGLSGQASIMPFPPTLFAQNPQNSFSSNPSAWRNPHSQHSITHPNQPHYIPVALLAENYSSPQLMNSYNNTHSLIQNSPLVNNVNIPILPTAPDFAQIHRAILVPKSLSSEVGPYTVEAAIPLPQTSYGEIPPPPQTSNPNQHPPSRSSRETIFGSDNIPPNNKSSIQSSNPETGPLTGTFESFKYSERQPLTDEEAGRRADKARAAIAEFKRELNSIVPAAIPLPGINYGAIPTPPPPPPQSDYEDPSRQTYNPNQHPSIAHHQYYLPSRSSREAMFASALPSQYASALPSQYGSALPLPSQYGSALPLPFQHSQLSVKYNGEQTPILYTTNPLLPTQLVQYGNEPNPLSYLGSNHMPAVTTSREVTSRLEEPPTTSHSSSVYTLKTSPELILEPANNEEKQNLSSEPSNSQKDPTRDSNSPTGAFFTTSLIYLANKISGLFEGTLPNSEKKEAKAETNTTSQTPPVLIKNQETSQESSTPSKVPTLTRDNDQKVERYTQLSPDSGRQIAQAG